MEADLTWLLKCISQNTFQSLINLDPFSGPIIQFSDFIQY